MKKYLPIIIGIFFFTGAIISFAADMCAAGWGTSADNGTWTDRASQVNGKDSYTRGGRYMYWPSDGNGWYISGADLTNTCPHYYDNTTQAVATPDLVTVTNWVQGCGSDLPTGTITAGACAGAAAPPSFSDFEWFWALFF